MVSALDATISGCGKQSPDPNTLISGFPNRGVIMGSINPILTRGALYAPNACFAANYSGHIMSSYSSKNPGKIVEAVHITHKLHGSHHRLAHRQWRPCGIWHEIPLFKPSLCNHRTGPYIAIAGENAPPYLFCDGAPRRRSSVARTEG